MSGRSKLLMEAAQRIRNPFLLCSVISKRARQLTSGNGNYTTAEIVDYAFNELLAGALEFKGNADVDAWRRAPEGEPIHDTEQAPSRIGALPMP